MIDKKKCKGQSKAYGVKGCGNLVKAKTRKYGLCYSCLSDFLLNNDKGKLILEKATLKATKQRREFNKASADHKANKSLGALKEQTQMLFNRYIKLRDIGKPCISSGVPYRNTFEAGHAFSVGSYEGLRYLEDNVHGQSFGDNRFKEGNVSEYLLNLPKRIGQERFERLIKAAEAYKKNGYKFTRDELKEIQEDIKAKIKLLKP
jgi:hypothetical protein